MNRCKTCRHWQPDSMAPNYYGTCEHIEADSDLFQIVDEPVSYGNGNGPVHVETGADFRCVLWEAKP